MTKREKIGNSSKKRIHNPVKTAIKTIKTGISSPFLDKGNHFCLYKFRSQLEKWQGGIFQDVSQKQKRWFS